MTSANHTHNRVWGLILTTFLVISGASVLTGQTKQLLTWQENLNYLQNITDSDLEYQVDLVGQIRTGVEFWLELHPKSSVQLPDAPPQPWNTELIRDEISMLQETVKTLLKQESRQPFELGVTSITVTSELSPLSPIADSTSSTEIENHHATDVTKALQFLPGLSIDYKSSRNQAGIYIRGFDTRQVGLYLDNIPIYVPYDGYADISRFLTSGVSEIQVAKGYSSPLLGPNGLGGAVNIVTRQPEEIIEGQLTIGTGSGDRLETGIEIGSRWNKFIFQGGINWFQTDYYPVSGNFNPADDVYETQPSYERTNSYMRDANYNGRVGFLPNDQDSYIFSFMGQKAEYGAPPYSGWDEENNSPKYWRWPSWNRDSYYFNGKKGLGEKNDLQFRVFYDKYPNMLNDYSDITYSTLESSSSYDDHSGGLSAEWSTRILNRNTIGVSFFFKDDTHTEFDVEYEEGVPTEIPSRTHRDQQMSIGVQDSISLTSRIRATLGFSAENINGIKAQDLVGDAIEPFACAGEAGAASYSGCINEWAFNPLGSLSFSITKSGTFFVTYAKKSHFPTMKDRYSYKNNKAIPNPTLQPEHARNWNIGYSHVFPKTMFQIELFRSDIYDAIERAYVPEPVEDLCRRSGRMGYCEQSINVGKAINQGVELIFRSNRFSHITLDLQYSYLSRSISNPDPEDVPQTYPTGTPKHKVVGKANIMLPRDISLLATARYESGTVGDFYIDEEDYLIPIPGSNFATFDLGGIIPIYAGLRLQAGVNNLLDRNYYYREGFPREGRNWFFNMKYRF